jgi:putative phosphoesterase
MLRIGILSDTHLPGCTDLFRRQTELAFSDCTIIIHAGDLVDQGILSAFGDKEIHVVHGNMCNATVKRHFPSQKMLNFEGFSLAICHGAGDRMNIEDRLLHMFPTADCIIYGHTHMAVQKKIGRVLFINPGSFQGTGRFGAAGSYAILVIDTSGLSATIHELPPIP